MQEPLSPTRAMEVGILRPMPSLETTLGQLSLNPAGTDDYSKQFIGLKGAVISALNEMTVEVSSAWPFQFLSVVQSLACQVDR